MTEKHIPKCIFGHFTVFYSLLWTASQGTSSFGFVTTDRVGVVSVVLGEGLLQNGSPECRVRGYPGEKGSPLAIVLLFHGQVVVDSDIVGDSESIHGHNCETVRSSMVLENFLNTAWHFCDGGAGSVEPAVADNSLSDIIRSYTVGSKERGLAGKLSLGAIPAEATQVLIVLAHISPEERRVVVIEVIVGVLVSSPHIAALIPFFSCNCEVFKNICFLISVMSKAASVVRAFGVQLSEVLE